MEAVAKTAMTPTMHGNIMWNTGYLPVASTAQKIPVSHIYIQVHLQYRELINFDSSLTERFPQKIFKHPALQFLMIIIATLQLITAKF